MTRRILIFADDLTGATDSAATFVDRKTVVTLDLLSSFEGKEVVAFDLNTRALTPEAAIETTSRALQHTAPGAEDVLFKKVDSALRGNIAHELAAMLAWRRRTFPDREHVFAIMAPAFPAHHRVTRGGCQLHRERPLHASELWPGERIALPDTIADLLAQASLSSICVPQSRIHDGGGNFLNDEVAATETLPDVVICDAESDMDLQAIVQAALRTESLPILVGSAGLARQLALATSAAPSRFMREARSFDGPILTVLGTMAAASHRQAQRLMRYAALNPIVVPVTALLDANSKGRHQASTAIRRDLEEGRNVLVIAGGGALLNAAGSRKLPAELGHLLRPFGSHAGALIATGGETARAILEAWGISKLELVTEIEAGIPCCQTLDWERSLPVITKSGSFGDDQTLVRAYDFLMRQKAAA